MSHEQVQCQKSIDWFEQGRYYDNRFGVRYDSSPNTIYWHFN
jgi:hypothetical protein